MKKQILCACALVGAAGFGAISRGAVVEFRIVERTGQTIASPADNVLDYSIQARVTGGAGLALWGFDCLRLTGEGESTSVIQRLQISIAADGTYYGGAPALNNSVGVGGVARTYSYLAGLDSRFNGLVNISSGVFVNTPDNELGLLSGAAASATLLGTPGVDGNQDGRPDSIPTPLTSGVLSPAAMQQYFAQDQFIDVYRFRITVTDFTPRLIPINLINGDARVFDQVGTNNDDVWGPIVHDGPETLVVGSGLIQVTPAPSSIALLGVGGLIAARRRRA